MDEDVGAKAPVTRLRRRLSVEQSEEVKSPAAPSTPSKKRGGRLAAKPQLELIDENASENTPRKQTRKTAKEVFEAGEDKVLTPGRRSTRIKSNTSILSDTPQGFDSPRAKRAARRNSQIGSDNEAPVTPARQTRRTRKDSTTSVDTQETVTSAKKSTPTVAHSIVEEAETDLKSSSTLQNENTEITPKRKSPRLLKKDKQGETTENEESLKENNVTGTKKASDKKISDESFQLINNLNDPVYKTKLNNSTSSVNSKKSTKNRTKSWTGAEDLPGVKNDAMIQNKKEKKRNDDVKIKKSESNNNILEADNRSMKNDNVSESVTNKENNVTINIQTSDKSLHEISNPEISHSMKTNDLDNTVNNDSNETQKILKKAPVAAVQSFIYYDDSDSDNKGKSVVSDQPIESGDQCVPFVPEINHSEIKSIFNQNENRVSYDDTCEPMDIDETIPNNVSLINSSDSKQEKDSLDNSVEKELKTSISKSPNKSKRESTSSLSISQNIEKTENENKSTLILSQLKDVSATDNSLCKSPKTAVDFLSKSVNDVNKDKDVVKKDSHDYMTSTPLQQKNLKKMAVQINTSGISNSNNTSTNTSVKKYNKNDSKQSNKSCDDSSSEDSESEHVSAKDKNDFLDDEAEEASDNYESGDSQDEEERRYEKENEILAKGETLDSSDNASNDTDYEKDSFVVSSDEEDNDLLSGSGDDLSMSDNELTQSKKSKKKFDERKLKKSKKASREMFEARHNISSNSTKSDVTKGKKNKRQRLDSSTLVSEEETVVKSKKNKRMKLDSSQESSTEDVVDSKEAKNNGSFTEEQEITSVCNESVMNKNDPLLVKIKSEPSTPLKDMNISTVPIHDQIEEIHVDQNISIMKANETSDPLQDDSDASSISENMEITSNYDSVLKELNDVKGKKIKTLDMSFNMNKKTKMSAKPPIVDNLNLTNSKKSKNANTSICDDKSKFSNSDKQSEKKADFDDSSSDSIDLQLLFSEDSCDSEKKDQSKTKPEAESFIPLKRTEAKTNILDDNTNEDRMHNKQDMDQSYSDALNNSLNKKKKKRNSMPVSEDVTNEKTNISLNKSSHEVAMSSILDTSFKKKNKNISLSETDGLDNGINSSDVQQKLDISLKDNQNISMNAVNKSDKKKKKNSICVSDDTNLNDQGEAHKDNVCDISTGNTLNTSSKKKKHSISLADEVDIVNNTVVNIYQNEINHNISFNKSLDTSSKKKKKKHSISVNEESDTIKFDQTELNNSLNKDNTMNNTLDTSSKKKKKKHSISVNEESDTIKFDQTELNNSLNKNNQDNTMNNTLDTSSKKKKKKHSISVNEESDTIKFDQTELNNSLNKNNQDNTMNNTLDTSSKKKKKKHSISVNEESDTIKFDQTELNSSLNKDNHNYTMNNTFNTSSKKNKKNSVSVSEDTDNNTDINSVLNTSSKKKKKNSISISEETDKNSNTSTLNNSSKKNNNSISDEQIDSGNKSFEDLNVKGNSSMSKSSKKKKKHNSSDVADLDVTASEVTLECSLNSSAKKKSRAADLQTNDKENRSDDSDAPEEIPYTSHKNISAGDLSGGVHMFVDTEGNQDWNALITSGSSKKKNKKTKSQETPPENNDITAPDNNDNETTSLKKRKRKSSNCTSEGAATTDPDLIDEPANVEHKTKKQKISQSEDTTAEIKEITKKKSKKRKERDDDDVNKTSKILKQNSIDKINVPRLPPTILNQLEDKPRKEVLEMKKAKVVSTTQFVVEEAKKRKNKPSNYLEESVYLNESVDEKKQKGFIKIPKVLPFVPTATISASGFTTKFQINVLQKETKFVAQTSNLTGFKNEYLGDKKIKKSGTYEMYKSQRNRKMSKF